MSITLGVELPFRKKNFLSEEELQWFRDYLEDLNLRKELILLPDLTREQIETKMNDWIVDHFLGRIQCSLAAGEFPEDKLAKLNAYAKSINPNAEFRYISFVRYSTKYGQPQLGPHLDPPTNEHFMFDIQLNSNIDWPIVVDNEGVLEEHTIEDNEALILDITRQTHWRKPVKFQDGDYLDMLFVSYTDSRIEVPSLEWQGEQVMKRMGDYGWQLLEIFPELEDQLRNGDACSAGFVIDGTEERVRGLIKEFGQARSTINIPKIS